MDARERAGGIGFIAAIHGLAIWALISALGINGDDFARASDTILKTFTVQPPPPPPPANDEDSGEEGAQSSAGDKAEATPVVAPKVEMPSKSPVKAAPDPLDGTEAKSGQTDLNKDGSGSDGIGDSTGTGNSGTGSGSGGFGNGTGSGKLTAPVKIAGNIAPKDFKKATGFSASAGQVTVFYTVQPNGRVTNCHIRAASGNAERDALTCKLIEKRWRYKPARNAAGDAVAYETGWNQRWWPERDYTPPPSVPTMTTVPQQPPIQAPPQQGAQPVAEQPPLQS